MHSTNIMNTISRFVNYLIITIGLFFALTANAFEKDSSLIVKVVDEFCKAEIGGQIESRRALVRFSPKRLQQEASEKAPALPGTLFPNYDPVTVIDDYRVKGVIITNESTAIGKVTYTQIAHLGKYKDSPKITRTLTPIRETVDVDLQLRKIDGKWYVYDVDQAKVGIETMISLYRDQIRLSEESHKGESHPRLEQVRKFQQDILAALIKLR
jgi:ABC-type transporter MlaC component